MLASPSRVIHPISIIILGCGSTRRADRVGAGTWSNKSMVEDLETLSSKELYSRAVDRAVRHLDVGFLWRLLKAIPAAEAAAGHPDQAEADVSHLSAMLNEFAHAGESEVADALRPLYIDYLRRSDA